jgi:Beta-1,3-glucanase
LKLDRRLSCSLALALALTGTLAACAGGGASLPGSSSGANPSALRAHTKAALPSTTLTFVNKSNTASKDVWFCYYGLSTGADQTPLYLADAKGTLAKSVPSSKPTTSLCLNVADSTSFVFPELNAARLYVSYGKPLSFAVGANARPIPPNPADTKDPNYDTQWDFFELSYVPETGAASGRFNFNLSVLQSANLNMQFAVKGEIPGTKIEKSYTRGWKPGGEAAFVQQMQANKDYDGLVLAGSNRVLAPGTAIQAYAAKLIPKPIFPANYFANYVDQTWTKYQTDTLTFVGDPPAGSSKFVTWTGKVVKNQFVFTPPADNTLGLKPMIWNQPSSSDIFENNFLFCVDGCGKVNPDQANYALQIFGSLMAAYNRSVMLTETTFTNNPGGKWCTDQSDWYKDPTTNVYADVIHENSLMGLAYAFQSDDHCDVSSFVAVWNPEDFTITLQN